MNNSNTFSGVKNTPIQDAINNTIFQLKPNTVQYISSDNQVISTETLMTSFTNTGSNYSATLPAAEYIGQIKYIMIGDKTSDTPSTITIHFNNSTGNATTTTLQNFGDMDELFGVKGGFWSEW